MCPKLHFAWPILMTHLLLGAFGPNGSIFASDQMVISPENLQFVLAQECNSLGPSHATDDVLMRLPPGGNQIIPETWATNHGGTIALSQMPAPLVPPNDPPAEKKYPDVKLGGFFQVDSVWFAQDMVNIDTVGDIQNGADFRRARLSAQGDLTADVAFMIEFDFAFPGRPSFMDVYLDLKQFPRLGTLRVGQWRQPFGMDGQTSVRELTFLERGLPFAFLPFRQIGVGFFDNSADETMTWAVSGFRFPTDAYGGNVGDSGGYAMASRVTLAPHLTPDDSRLVAIGGGYVFGDPSTNRVRYLTPPEVFIQEIGGADLVPPGALAFVPPFVDTGPIDAENFQLFAAEGGLTLGSLYMQTEAIYSVVNQINGPQVSFAGAYMYAGYFLTGEVRPYNRQKGVFGRVKPLEDFAKCSGLGAWEVAGRWSYIDLNDQNILGGRLNDLTFGLNWYLNQRTKFQFNYIHAFLDDPAFGDSDANILRSAAR